MYNYNAIITNIVDGDTYDVDIDLGFHIHIHERIRVLNLDTPEKRGGEKELGKICTDYAKQHFLGKTILLCSKEEIKEPETDSFGRWLCHVYIGGRSIANLFSTLGCNKYENNYKPENVYKLRDSLKESTQVLLRE